MKSPKSQFLSFDELASVLGVSVKKLRADLDIGSGEIRLGGTVPAIPTLKIGHLRMVARGVLDRWLASVGAINEEETRAGGAPEVEETVRRPRGRPRRKSAASSLSAESLA